jgi:hypothetical protein
MLSGMLADPIRSRILFAFTAAELAIASQEAGHGHS